MSKFVGGVTFTVGMALFGKSMYELGKLKEQKEDAKRWNEMRIKLEVLQDIIRAKRKEETES